MIMLNESTQSSVPTCGLCASWEDDHCHCPDSPHAYADRKSDYPACVNYMAAHKMDLHTHGFGWHVKDWIVHHVKISLGIVIIVAVFLGAWFITGDIWAAIILLEIILDIMGGLDF